MKHLLLVLFLLGFAFAQDAWTANYRYVPFDRVTYNNTVYEALTAHTATLTNNVNNGFPHKAINAWRVYRPLTSATGSNLSVYPSSSVDLSADYAALSWLFLAGLGAGILSKLLGVSLYRVFTTR